MNKCKVCNKECNGNTCSGACRAKLSRRTVGNTDKRTRTVETEAHAHGDDKRTVIEVGEGVVTLPPLTDGQVIKVINPASLADYQDPDGRTYADRTAADKLNWSTPMSMMELKQNGLTGNRQPIPGDWDYDGCCEQVDGKWQVKAGV
ncbi:hypothetical protein KAU11_09595 [Candidatus Babeliales bacterium]|nr:hypothetical protein [Candidatus Babeliales bacterium]